MTEIWQQLCEVFSESMLCDNWDVWCCSNREVWQSFLLLLVWQAPLGVRSTKCRHQSPEWTILSHSYRLIQGEIVWSQVLLNSLHPRSSRTSWFPPVLWRGSSYDTPGIYLVWYSCNMAEQSKMPCLDSSRQAWLPGCPSRLVIPHVMVPFDS